MNTTQEETGTLINAINNKTTPDIQEQKLIISEDAITRDCCEVRIQCVQV